MTILWHLPLNILQIKCFNLTNVYLELMNKHMFHSCTWAFVEPLDQHSRMNEVWWDMENTVTFGFVQKGYGCEKDKLFRCIQGSHNAGCKSLHFSNLSFWEKRMSLWNVDAAHLQSSNFTYFKLHHFVNSLDQREIFAESWHSWCLICIVEWIKLSLIKLLFLAPIDFQKALYHHLVVIKCTWRPTQEIRLRI